jgi:hypothetical protein
VISVICLLCLIVLPLPPGKNPFTVKINNNDKKQQQKQQQQQQQQPQHLRIPLLVPPL